MYDYLRGAFQRVRDGAVTLEVGEIGYSVLVSPLAEQRIAAEVAEGEELLLYVAAQSSQSDPWPVLIGFRSERERDFWRMLTSVQRLGGRSALKMMNQPIGLIAKAIVEGDRVWLDSLPGITLDSADKLITALRKKAMEYLEVGAMVGMVQPAAQPALRTVRDEMRDDAVQMLASLGLRKPDAARRVDLLLSSHPEITTVQDVMSEYFRSPVAA